jgi:hypothetical protein
MHLNEYSLVAAMITLLSEETKECAAQILRSFRSIRGHVTC